MTIPIDKKVIAKESLKYFAGILIGFSLCTGGYLKLDIFGAKFEIGKLQNQLNATQRVIGELANRKAVNERERYLGNDINPRN